LEGFNLKRMVELFLENLVKVKRLWRITGNFEKKSPKLIGLFLSVILILSLI